MSVNVAAQSAAALSADAAGGREKEKVSHPWQDYDAVMRHANRARATGDLPRAHAFYTRAIELNPNSAPAWSGRASTTSNLDEAIISWGYALAIAPDRETRALLDACVTEKIKQSDAAQVKTLVFVARRLAEAGHRAWAHRLLVSATELAPLNEEFWVWRAGLTNDTTETIVCLNRALELNPHNAQAKAGLQWVEKKTGMPASAPLSAAEQAVRVVEEGQRALQAGDRPRAHERFGRATELDPQNAVAWFWRGSVAPDVDEALACMARVLEIDPKNEAAKDARWWLQIRKMRGRIPALATNPPRASANVYAHEIEMPPGRISVIAILVIFSAALLVVSLIAFVVLVLLTR